MKNVCKEQEKMKRFSLKSACGHFVLNHLKEHLAVVKKYVISAKENF